MIIVVCTDDPSLMGIAAQASVSNQPVYGNYYQVFAGQIPPLGTNENLFVLAHGVARGDDGNPVIGDENNALYLNAVQLLTNLESLFPDGYRGSIYVSACEVLSPGINSLSFAEMLLAVIQAHFPNVRVYGHRNAAGQLPPPGSSNWIQAASTHQGTSSSSQIIYIDPQEIAVRNTTVDPNGEMIQKIYSKLSSVVSVGSSIQAPGNSFLVLASPGIFVDPNLDLQNADDQFLWASVLNRIPLPNFIYGDSGQSLDSLYDLILTGKELPLVELTPDQKKKLDEAIAVTEDDQGEPTRDFERYFEYQSEYYEALAAFQEAKANSENEGIPIPAGVQAKLKAAKSKWTTLGKRQKIEKAIATIENLQGLDPNNWWANSARNLITFRQLRQLVLLVRLKHFLATRTFSLIKDGLASASVRMTIRTKNQIRASRREAGLVRIGDFGEHQLRLLTIKMKVIKLQRPPTLRFLLSFYAFRLLALGLNLLYSDQERGVLAKQALCQKKFLMVLMLPLVPLQLE